MGVELKTICCRNKDLNNYDDIDDSYIYGNYGDGNPKETKSDKPTYLTIIGRGLSRAIELKEKKFQINYKNCHSSVANTGICIIVIH